MTARSHEVAITVRGRSEASRRVDLRAETDGRIVEVGASRGDAVREGRVLARLTVEGRRAKIAEYKARLRQRRIHFEATEALAKKGLSSREALATAKADIDAAKAAVEQVEVEIAPNTPARPVRRRAPARTRGARRLPQGGRSLRTHHRPRPHPLRRQRDGAIRRMASPRPAGGGEKPCGGGDPGDCSLHRPVGGPPRRERTGSKSRRRTPATGYARASPPTSRSRSTPGWRTSSPRRS